MVQELRICIAGFGAVGQRFCRLLLEKETELAEKYACRILLTGVSTPSRGTLLNPRGLDLNALLRMEEAKRRFDRGLPGYRDCGVFGMLEECVADVFCELTTLSISDGQPATAYIMEALDRGMHVITANKGPEAHHFRELRDKAAAKNRLFLYETIVLDGTPVFNLFSETLRDNRVLGIRGILNGTTNFVLDRLEQGVSYEEAIREAQHIQLAEADPSMDVDGWDGAAKICALANILMDADLRPADAAVKSIREITAADLAEAKAQGKRIKYVCAAQRDGSGQVKLSVEPQLLPLDHAFCTVNGTSAAITLYTDLAGELTIIQTNPGILQTAYGVYGDLLTLLAKVASGR